ncbi:hypothetical protein [Persephonella sp.]
MSIIERVLFWIAIIVLSVSIIGLRADISELEQKAKDLSSYTVSPDEDGGEEE